MFRITRIVPTTVLTLAALALASPAAQARLESGQFGGSGSVSPSVQSTQDMYYGKTGVVVTTGDMPLANPVQLPKNLNAGLLHAGLTPGSVQQAPTTTAVTAPESSGDGIDWTAAAIGSALVGILLLTIVAGYSVRQRGRLAT